MNETILAIYLSVWLACAVGSVLFFWGRSPQFKKRWHRRVAAFDVIVIGGMLIAATIPHWRMLFFFAGASLFIGWVAVFQTRVCPSCGKVSQPANLVSAPNFCRKCGMRLA